MRSHLATSLYTVVAMLGAFLTVSATQRHYQQDVIIDNTGQAWLAYVQSDRVALRAVAGRQTIVVPLKVETINDWDALLAD